MTVSSDRPGGLILPNLQTPGAGRSGEVMEPDGVPGGERRPWAEVPWRTIIGSIAMVVLSALLFVILYRASRIVILIVLAGFFAVVLARPVGWMQRRFRLRRGTAIAVVMISFLALLGGLLALFIIPVRTQLVAVLTDLPGTVQQASRGQGPVGHLVSKLQVEHLVKENQASLTRAAKSIQDSLPALVGSAIQTTLSVVTVALMTCLMLSQSESLGRTTLKAVPIRHRDWIGNVARDAGRAISGYMIGNLLISLCAGIAAFVFLLAMGVRNPAVLALWVAFADLIPLVGATIGAVVAVIAAFFVSPTAGIIAIVYFFLYQQFENSVLQIQIMARTVQVNPLIVLLSVLLGVELFGVIGALLGVPMAGALSVIAKELWRHRPSNPDELIIVTSGDHAAGAPKASRWSRLPWKRAKDAETPIG